MTYTITSTETQIYSEDLLTAATQAYHYVQSKIIQTDHGIKYSLVGSANSDPYFDEISLYSGSAGIIHFLLHLYEVTDDPKYLSDAEAAFPYILYRWKEARELSLAFSPWAFTTGYTGVAFSVIELYQKTSKAEYKIFVEEVVDALVADAKPSDDGDGSYWTGSFGILADSGTLLFALYAAKAFDREDWKKFAIEAGRVLLNKGIDFPKGGRYFEGSSFGGKIIPGFPIGTGGVAFTLLKLYQASQDSAFLDAAQGTKEFYHAIYEYQGDTISIPHDLHPDGHTDDDTVHYLGFCGGNAGLIRYLYEDFLTTGDKEDLDEIKQLTQSLVDLGAPEHHSEGYWNTIAYCCGSVGFLNAFLSVWQVTGEEKFLDYAKRTAASLLADGQLEENRLSWKEAYTRLEPDNITAPIGFYEGAAGAGSVLLQLYSALKGDYKVHRILDDPFPSTY